MIYPDYRLFSKSLFRFNFGVDQFHEVGTLGDGHHRFPMVFVIFLLRAKEEEVSGEDFLGIPREPLVEIALLAILCLPYAFPIFSESLLEPRLLLMFERSAFHASGWFLCIASGPKGLERTI